MSLLAARLNALAPAGVDPTETAVRAEPGSADAVVPHCHFRGLAMAATVAGSQVEVYWLRVHTLERSDDFDAETNEGWPVVSRARHGEKWIEAAVEHFAAELARPFTVRAQYRGRGDRPAKNGDLS